MSNMRIFKEKHPKGVGDEAIRVEVDLNSRGLGSVSEEGALRRFGARESGGGRGGLKCKGACPSAEE